MSNPPVSTLPDSLELNLHRRYMPGLIRIDTLPLPMHRTTPRITTLHHRDITLPLPLTVHSPIRMLRTCILHHLTLHVPGPQHHQFLDHLIWPHRVERDQCTIPNRIQIAVEWVLLPVPLRMSITPKRHITLHPRRRPFNPPR